MEKSKLNRDQMIKAVTDLYAMAQSEEEDYEIMRHVGEQVPHAAVTDLMFWRTPMLSSREVVDTAIQQEANYVAYLRSGAEATQGLDWYPRWNDGSCTREEMVKAVVVLRAEDGTLPDLGKLFNRLDTELSHASIGDLIFRDKVGLTPEQVIEAAIQRHAEHIDKLVVEMKQSSVK